MSWPLSNVSSNANIYMMLFSRIAMSVYLGVYKKCIKKVDLLKFKLGTTMSTTYCIDLTASNKSYIKTLGLVHMGNQ